MRARPTGSWTGLDAFDTAGMAILLQASQIDAFRETGLRAFESEMAAHLRRFSPPLMATLDEAATCAVVRQGMAQAGGHGLDCRGPVRLYLELMLLFGSHFDTDPQYPWAADCLGESDPTTQMQRAEALYEQVCLYRAAVHGHADEHTFAALRRLRAFAAGPLALQRETAVDALWQHFLQLHPHKARRVGRAAMQDLIRHAARCAHEAGLPSLRGVALMAVLMLAFGHGCAEDPLYAWIGGTLRNPAIADGARREQRLESKALTWLDHALVHLDPQSEGKAA